MGTVQPLQHPVTDRERQSLGRGAVLDSRMEHLSYCVSTTLSRGETLKKITPYSVTPWFGNDLERTGMTNNSM